MTGQLREGERDVERGKDIREKLLAEQPLNIEHRADLARSYYHLTRIHVLAGETDPAKASIQKAEELYSTIPPKGPEDTYFRGCMRALHAELQTGRKADSELAAADRAERERRIGEAMAFLRQAVAAGYRNSSRFKTEPSLDSLRSRPDFQELVQSLSRP
jgi:hypothetical protein